MKVLGICGSPRRGGNTEILLNKALEGAESQGAETKNIILSDLNISPCQEIEYENVNDEGLSVIDDDMATVFSQISSADAVILASPVFFGSVSAQTKTMIDRFQCVWISKNILKKNIFSKKIQGSFISVQAAMREDFFDNARTVARHFFATINADCKEELYCPGIEKKGSILEHTELLEKAFDLGKTITSQ